MRSSFIRTIVTISIFSPLMSGPPTLCTRNKGTRSRKEPSTEAHKPLDRASREGPSAGGTSEVPPISVSPTNENKSACIKVQQINRLGLEPQRPVICLIIIKVTYKPNRKYHTNRSELPLRFGFYLCTMRRLE